MLGEFYAALPLTIDAIPDLPARLAPERIALESDTESVSYAELVRRRDALAIAIARAGLRRFERCGIAVRGGLDTIVWVLALARAGGVGVPLAAQLVAEAESLADSIALAAIVGPDGTLRRLRAASGESGETRSGAVPLDLDPALALATSGSEGRRRFVVLAHHALLANIFSNVRVLGLRDDDRTLVVLPLVHAYALVHQALSHLCVGATLRLWDGPMLPALLRAAIERHAITTIATVPALARLLVEAVPANPPPSRLRLVTIGAAHAPAPLVDALRALFGSARIALTYGLTQAGPRVATRFIDGETGDTACVGAPNPNVEIAIVERDGANVIAVRSRALMRSYADEPFEEGADGMLETGDVGQLVAGELVVSGRRTRAINRAGRLIAIERIEWALSGEARVRAVRVAGEAHPFYGEVAIAIVFVDQSDVGDAELEAALHARCARDLEPAERPLRIELQLAGESSYDGKDSAMLGASNGPP